VLIGVLDALALVRVGLPQLPELGRRLPDQRLVRTLDRDGHLLVHLGLDALRQRENHRVRVAKRQLQALALHLRAVPDADDLELALEAVLDAVDHVGDERAHQAVQRPHRPVLGAAADRQHVLLHRDGQAAGHRLAELALGPLRLDGLALDGDLDPLRDRDGLLADS